MPKRIKVYENGEEGVVVHHVPAIQADEMIRHDPDRYTLVEPDGKAAKKGMRARNPAAAPPPVEATDEQRQRAVERAAEMARENMTMPIEALDTGPDGAGTIFGGRDQTRSTGMEQTRFNAGEDRIAQENPVLAEEAEAERVSVQDKALKETAQTSTDDAPRRRRKREDRDDNE